MFEVVILLVAAILGGFFYRSRGGFSFVGGTQMTRLVYWVIPWSSFAWAFVWMQDSGDERTAVVAGLVGIFSFLGMLITHGQWYRAGTPHELAMMMVIGGIRGGLIALPMLWFSSWAWVIAVGGILSAFGYRYGRRWRVPFTLAVGGKVFVSPDDGLGEILVGMAYGFGAGAALLGVLGAV